ncbi:sensor histidine kinase [Gaetbulibacter jejuensis]|uniref:sensor histidine kinase n=1 Tax=Gaetbulibacter jejuensis TaxID=584607 RepID=UPI00300B2BAA
MRGYWKDNIVFCCLLLVSIQGFAQVHPNNNITVEDGLPSNAVYDLARDGSGTLWAATQHGLSSINGSEIKTYDEADGLPHNSCWQVTVDDANRVWVGTFGGGLAYYNGETFGTINQDDGLSDNRIRKLFFKSPNLYVGTQNGVSVVNTQTKQLKTFKGDGVRLQAMDFFEYAGAVYFITYTTGSYKIQEDAIIKINDDKAFFSAMVKNDSLYLSKDGNHRWFNSIHKTSVKDFLKNKRNYRDFGGSVFWDLQSIDGADYGAAWGVNLESGGFFKVAQNGLIALNQRYGIGSKKVYSMRHLPDTHQLLLATLDKGIYVLDLEHLVTITPKDRLKCTHTAKNGDVFYGFDDHLEIQSGKNLQTLSKRDFLNFTKKEIAYGLETRYPQKGRFRDFSLKQERLDTFFKVNSLSEFDGSIYMVSQIGIFKIDHKKQGYRITEYYPISAFEGFYVGPELGLVFQYPYNKVFMLDVPHHPKRIKRFELDNPNNPRDIIKFIKLGDRLFAVSRFKGIYCYKNGAFTSLLHNGTIEEREFVAARKVSDTALLAADYKGNIHRLTYNNTTVTFETVVDNRSLMGNGITAIDAYGEYIIASTNKGLNVFSSHTGTNRFLDGEQGLDATDIRDIQVDNNVLQLTTPKGRFNIDLVKLLDSEPKVVSIEAKSLKVDGADINLGSSGRIQLGHNQNQLEVFLTGKNIKYPKKAYYRYRILGLGDTEWTDWKSWYHEKHIAIPYLPAGDLDIELEYRDDFSGQVGCSKIVRAAIQKPFWNTIPFYLLAVVSIISIAYILTRWRFKVLNKRQKQKSILEKRIAEAKMEALRSQMNPHFVFNAIGAIQNFVIDNDTDSSLDYMNSFSKLIRKTLDYSSKKSITIQEEVDFLKLFVKIQNLRFGDRVQFAHRVSRDIDRDLLEIPPMLLQPIVENCFEHAFDGSIKNPKINLSFELKGLFLEITVRDTGRGIKTPVKAKSKGLKLVEERLKLIHPENRLEITSNTGGTSVKIVLRAH